MLPASRLLRTYQSLYCRNSVGFPSFTRTPSCLPTISSRSRRPYSSQMTDIVFPDPNRPDLFYHVVNPPTPLSKTLPGFAISFLHCSPPHVDSSTVIGWLPAETYMTDSPGTPGMDHAHQNKETSAGLRDFVGNRECYLHLRDFSRGWHAITIAKFVTLLHKTIQSALSENLDEIWENGAKQLQEGWMHIHGKSLLNLLWYPLSLNMIITRPT